MKQPEHPLWTKVVNVKDSFYEVYIGRPSIVGNPYKIGVDGTREEVIQKYKEYFNDKILNDRHFRLYILSLMGKTLGCYCKPLSCHGDIIANFLNRYADKKEYIHNNKEK
jgi:hypothetical protein